MPGLGAAAAGFLGIECGGCATQTVLGMRVGGDDVDGEPYLEGVGGIEGGDRGHGGVLAPGAIAGRVGGEAGHLGAQGGEGFADDGWVEVCDGVHEGDDRLLLRKGVGLGC